jgi:hypothetical protein
MNSVRHIEPYRKRDVIYDDKNKVYLQVDQQSLEGGYMQTRYDPVKNISFKGGYMQTRYDPMKDKSLKINKNRVFGGNIFKRGLRKILNAYRKYACPSTSRQLEEGEFHPFCANFEGPGTRIDIEEYRNMNPVNEADAIAKVHDIEYFTITQDSLRDLAEGKDKDQVLREASQKIHESDEKFIRSMDKLEEKVLQGFADKDNLKYIKYGRMGIRVKHWGDKILSFLKNTPSVVYGLK